MCAALARRLPPLELTDRRPSQMPEFTLLAATKRLTRMQMQILAAFKDPTSTEENRIKAQKKLDRLDREYRQIVFSNKVNLTIVKMSDKVNAILYSKQMKKVETAKDTDTFMNSVIEVNTMRRLLFVEAESSKFVLDETQLLMLQKIEEATHTLIKILAKNMARDSYILE